MRLSMGQLCVQVTNKTGCEAGIRMYAVKQLLVLSQGNDVSLRILAKAFTAVIPRPCPRASTPETPASGTQVCVLAC